MGRIKYPRTPHLLWSPGRTSDDEVIESARHFIDRQVVLTEKLDGECTTIYPDGTCHARSTDSSHHPSRSWMKQLAGAIGHDIPEGWRLCGENLYAFHSIWYKDLSSYFFVYGVYDEQNNSLPWSTVEDVTHMLGLHTVPVLYKGIWDERVIRTVWTGKSHFSTFESKISGPPTGPDDFEPTEGEGYVVRLADGFHYTNFSTSVAKFVRYNHVQTDAHWMSRPPFPNLLRQVGPLASAD